MFLNLNVMGCFDFTGLPQILLYFLRFYCTTSDFNVLLQNLLYYLRLNHTIAEFTILPQSFTVLHGFLECQILVLPVPVEVYHRVHTYAVQDPITSPIRSKFGPYFERFYSPLPLCDGDPLFSKWGSDGDPIFSELGTLARRTETQRAHV